MKNTAIDIELRMGRAFRTGLEDWQREHTEAMAIHQLEHLVGRAIQLYETAKSIIPTRQAPTSDVTQQDFDNAITSYDWVAVLLRSMQTLQETIQQANDSGYAVDNQDRVKSIAQALTKSAEWFQKYWLMPPLELLETSYQEHMERNKGKLIPFADFLKQQEKLCG